MVDRCIECDRTDVTWSPSTSTAAAPLRRRTASGTADQPEALVAARRHPRRSARSGAQRAAVAGHHRGRAPRHAARWSTTSSVACGRSRSSRTARCTGSGHGRAGLRRRPRAAAGARCRRGRAAPSTRNSLVNPAMRLVPRLMAPTTSRLAQLVGRVVGDLGAGAQHADHRTEVDGHLPGRLAGLGERLHLHDATDAQVEGEEPVGTDVGLAVAAARVRRGARRDRWCGARAERPGYWPGMTVQALKPSSHCIHASCAGSHWM